jgi:hypothetical protein
LEKGKERLFTCNAPTLFRPSGPSIILARIAAGAGAGLLLGLASAASAAGDDQTLRTGAQVSRDSRRRGL